MLSTQLRCGPKNKVCLEFLLGRHGTSGVSAAPGLGFAPSQAWHSGLKIQHCRSSGSHLIPGPGTPYAAGGQKKEKKIITLFKKNNNKGVPIVSQW